MGLTIVEKIANRHATGLGSGKIVRAGDYVTIKPKHVMTHDNTGAVIPKFRTIGAKGMADRSQPVFAIDHDIQNKSDGRLLHAHGAVMNRTSPMKIWQSMPASNPSPKKTALISIRRAPASVTR